MNDDVKAAVDRFERMLKDEYQTHPDRLSRLGRIYRTAVLRDVGVTRLKLKTDAIFVRRYPGELLYLRFPLHVFPRRILVRLRREFPMVSYDLGYCHDLRTASQPSQPRAYAVFGAPDVMAIPFLVRARELSAGPYNDAIRRSLEAIEADLAATDFVSGFMDPYPTLFLRAGAPRMLVDAAFCILYAEAEQAGAGFRLDALKRAYAETLTSFQTKSGGPRLEPVDSLMERDDGQES